MMISVYFNLNLCQSTVKLKSLCCEFVSTWLLGRGDKTHVSFYQLVKGKNRHIALQCRGTEGVNENQFGISDAVLCFALLSAYAHVLHYYKCSAYFIWCNHRIIE